MNAAPDASRGAPPVIELVDVDKVYKTRRARGRRAARRVDMRIDEQRVRRDRRTVRVGQVDAHAHPRLPRRRRRRGVFRLAGHDVARLRREHARRRPQRLHRLRVPAVQPAAPTSARGATSSSRSCTRASTQPSAATVRLPRSTRSGCADRADHRPGELSGGQQQRVAIARAAGDRARDDPRRRADRQPRLAGRPPRSCRLLEDLNREGRTIVLITHERDIAAARRPDHRDPRRPGLVPAGAVGGPIPTAEARDELARHVPHRDRGGPLAPAPLGAHDARDPDRHHRRRAHGRARVRAPRPRCRTRSTSSARTCSWSRPAARRAAPGSRGGFGSASTLTRDDATALASHGVGARRHRGRTASRPRASARERLDQLDHDADRHDAELARRCAPAASPPGASSPPPTRTTRRRCRARSRHRSRAVRRRDPVGQSVSYNGVQLEVIGVLTNAELVGGDVEQRPRHRPAEHVRAAARRRREPRLGELDLREGDVRRRRCRPRTRRPNALLLNVHGITTAANADFSIATQQSILSGRELGRRHADGDARRHRGHRAARRRHRRDEHHAGVGHRADPRDRRAQGDRRATGADPPPVPRRGLGARASPAECSAWCSASSARSSSPRSRLARDPVGAGGGDRDRGGGRHRRRVRRVPAPAAPPASRRSTR